MSSTAESPTPSGNAILAFLRRRWLSILLLVLVAVFVVQNREQVPVHLFNATVTAPMWSVLTGVLLIGIIAGAFGSRRASKRKAA